MSLFLCLWIELLNSRHGNYLPRKDIYPEANNNKWRDLSTQAAERTWRKNELGEIRTENYQPAVLTEEQKGQLDKFLENNSSNIFFHNLVRYSLLLYLLIPILSVAAILKLINTKEQKQKIILATVLFAQIICYYLMILRGFFQAIMA